MPSPLRRSRVAHLATCALVIAVLAWLGATRLVRYDFSPIAKRYVGTAQILVGDLDANGSSDIFLTTPRHVVASQFEDDRNVFDLTLPPDWILSVPRLVPVAGKRQDLATISYITSAADSSRCMLFTPHLTPQWSVLEPEGRLRWEHRQGGGASTKSAYFPQTVLTIGGRQYVLVFVITEYYGVGGRIAPRSVDMFDLQAGRRIWTQFMGPAPESFTLHDLNGDGTDEIIVGTYAPDNGADSCGTRDDECWVLAYDVGGRELWRVLVGGEYCGAKVAICDLDRNGHPEVVAGLHCKDRELPPGTVVVLDPETGREIRRAPWHRSVIDVLCADSLGAHQRDAPLIAVVEGPPEVLLLGPDLVPRRRQLVDGPEIALGPAEIAYAGSKREGLLLVGTPGALRGFDGWLRQRAERPVVDPGRAYTRSLRSRNTPDRIAIQDGAIAGIFTLTPLPVPSWMWIVAGIVLLLLALEMAWPLASEWRWRRVGSYRLLGEHPLGVGGMGETWLAAPRRGGNVRDHVVIKFLKQQLLDDEQSRARFRREATAVTRLVHENIAQVFHADVDCRRPHIVMQFVPGVTLKDRLGAGLTVKEAFTIARDIARALDFAHRQGILHRDITPRNVMVGDGSRATLLDFGLAKAQDPSIDLGDKISRSQDLIGTQGYIPPERIEGGISDWPGDVWAFGAVFYECLTGRPACPSLESLRRLPDWEGLLPDAPPAVRRLVEACLSHDPGQRPRMASVLAEIETMRC